MRNKIGNSAIYIEFALIVLMFLLSFITFKNIFSQTKGGDYFQEVIAALIGTLLTIIITFILLKQQTKTEELKEQNVEVFKKRIARYEEMIQLLVDVREDGEVDKKESQTLLKALYQLALVSSEDTIFTLSEYIQNLVFEDEEENDVGLLEVITCFRKELKLEGVDEFSINLESVESLLAGGFDKTEYSQAKQCVLDAREQIKSAIEKRVSPVDSKLYDLDTISRIGRDVMVTIVSNKTEVIYQVILERDPEDVDTLRYRVVVVSATHEDGNRKNISKAKMQLWENRGILCGFEIPEEGANEEWALIKIYPIENSRSRLSTRAVLNKMTPQIAQDILLMEGFDPEKKSKP